MFEIPAGGRRFRALEFLPRQESDPDRDRRSTPASAGSTESARRLFAASR
jgi:hypothetical protein